MIQTSTSLLAALMLATAMQAPAQNQLPPKTAQSIDQAVDAWQNGRLADALRLLSSVIEKATPDELKAGDQRVRELHEVNMTLVALATTSRVELVLDGQGGKLVRPAPAELPAALLALDDRMNQLLEPLRREAEVGIPAIIPDDVLIEKVGSLGPMLSQLDQAGLVLAYINQLRSQSRAPNRGKLDADAQAILDRKHADEQKKLEQLREKLTVRVVEFSLTLLNNSLTTVADENANFLRRFEATSRAGDSLAVLHAHWDQYKKAKPKSGGLDPALEARWKSQEEQVRQRAGPLAAKVYHLNEGVRWWLRGRYGIGPLAGGLAKLAPGGVTGDKAVQALINSPLFMPQNIRKPQNPLNAPAAFPIARRHLEWWRLETRVALPVREQSFLVRPSYSMANTSLVGGADTKLWGTPGRQGFQILETRPEAIRLAQLVGYVEYATALAHFERLVAACTPAEQRALEDMLGQDDRLVVHSNLSAKYDQLDPLSTLRLTNRPADPRATSANERRGLTWMMALARVEFGAMRAGHTGDSASPARRFDYARSSGSPDSLANNRSPFAALPPTKFDRDAFLEVLFDGMRQHFYEQRTEFQIPPGGAILGVGLFGPARIRLLQLERKLNVATEMLDAFHQLAGGSLNPAQQAELRQWDAFIQSQLQTIHATLNPPPPIAVDGRAGQVRPEGANPPPGQFKAEAQTKPNEPPKSDGTTAPPPKTKSDTDPKKKK